jgi:hypothetical protein
LHPASVIQVTQKTNEQIEQELHEVRCAITEIYAIVNKLADRVILLDQFCDAVAGLVHAKELPKAKDYLRMGVA